MTDDFGAAMRRTLDAVRNGDLAGATRIAQGALHIGPAAAPNTTPPPAPQAAAPKAAAPRFRVKPEAQEAEVVGETPVRTLFERLRDGFSGLADCGSPLSPSPKGDTEVPEGAQWLARHYAGPAGSRDFRLFLPSRGAEAATGLLLMLHGCKQEPEDFARGTNMLAVAEEAGLIVVFPEQPRIANLSGCWNWFEPGHQTAAQGEPAILAGLVRDLAREHGVAADRIFAAGLSAGGAMVAVLGEADPALFAAIGIHSGLSAGAAHDVASAFAAMDGRHQAGRAAVRDAGPRVILFHGDADATVAIGNADRLLGRRPSGTPDEVGISAGGRRYTRTLVAGRDGRTRAEDWRIEGAGHAWSGGSASGSYTDPAGPDASREMVRFFLSDG